MFTTFVQDGPAAEALEKTFSGESPCSFCHAADALAETTGPSAEDELSPAPRSVTTHLFAAAVADLVPEFSGAEPLPGALRQPFDLTHFGVDPLPG